VGGRVLESGSPGLGRRRDRLARRRSDGALADSIEREGVEAFVDRWEALPLFDGLRGLPAALRDSLRERRRSHHPEALAGSLRALSPGGPPNYWSRLWKLRTPTPPLPRAADAKVPAPAPAGAAALPQAVGHRL